MVWSILDRFDRIEAEAFFILAKRSSEIENELKKSHGMQNKKDSRIYAKQKGFKNFFNGKTLLIIVKKICSDAASGWSGFPQLTLLQPGGEDYAHYITASSPEFENQCYV